MMMSWQFPPFVLFLVLAGIISAVLASYAWRRRPLPGTVVFALLMLAVTEWSLAYALSLMSVALPAALFWDQTVYLGTVTIGPAWLIFVLQYTGREKWLTRRNIVLLAIIPLLTLALVWTNEAHGLIYTWTGFETVGSFLVLNVNFGPYFWVHIAYIYALLLVGTILLFRMLLGASTSRLHRGQIIAVLIGVLLPWVTNALEMAGVDPFSIPLDLTPFAITLTGLALTWGLYSFRFLDIIPVARDIALEGMREGMIVLDLQDRVVDLNPAAQDLIGVPMAQAIGTPIARLLRAWPDFVQCYQDSPETQAEITWDRNEQRRFYDMWISPLTDRHGRLIGRLIVLRDVTQRVQAEGQIRRLKEFNEDIVQNMTEGIILQDTKGYITFVNPAMAALLGYAPEEVMGLHWRAIIPPDQHPIVEAAEERRVLGESDRYELELVCQDDRRLSVLVSGSPRFEEGCFVGTMAVFADITDRKHAEKELEKHRDHLEELVQERTTELVVAKEQAEAADRAKSAFLANMSHELRTPLNAILGYAQNLRRRPLEADVINALKTVQQSGEHLLILIEDILTISKIETGRMELYPAQIDFPNFLKHIAGIIHARAKAKGLTFSFEELRALPAGVRVDATRLRQVLLNLLDNAIKFTDEGQVTLRVKCEDGKRELTHHVSRITFQVQDTGIGIAPDQVERIFQPFEQAGDVSRWTKGAGLGLAISRQLVHLMGGDIHVESKVGQGSTFWFEVALPVTEVTVEAAQPSERTIIGYRGPRRTVLVVDDIPSNRAVLVDLLQPLGFDVVEAVDGQQALHLAQELRPDLILMDRWMPVLDGFEAARRMQQIPELASVPTIAISSSVSKEDQAQSREVGIDAFLPKPVNWPRLATLLQERLALEWEYEETIEVGEKEGEAILVPPPAEEMEILLDLARRGDMWAIQERAAHIAALGEQYVPFARVLRELAQSFEEKWIWTLIERYMEKNQ